MNQNVAFTVTDEFEGSSEIIFHTHGLAARRIGADHLGVEFEDVTCMRSKQYDIFADRGIVPAKVLIEDGWQFECHHCGQQVCGDGDNTPVYAGDRTVFCDQSCKEAHEHRVKSINERGEEFRKTIKAKRPDLEFVKITTGWPFLSCHADFKFPGCKFGGSVNNVKGDNSNLEWRIANGDLDAWKEYEERRRAQKVAIPTR